MAAVRSQPEGADQRSGGLNQMTAVEKGTEEHELYIREMTVVWAMYLQWTVMFRNVGHCRICKPRIHRNTDDSTRQTGSGVE